ncbi:unnamed protein product [Ixodes persulcatus]
MLDGPGPDIFNSYQLTSSARVSFENGPSPLLASSLLFIW